MLILSKKTNLLEQETYKYSLQDVKDPNLFRDVYSYSEVPINLSLALVLTTL